MRNVPLLIALLSLSTLPVLCAAAPPAVETDARLQSDGPGWRLDRAKVVDPARPRVLLIGDSILGGYGKSVAAALAERAYVDAWVNPYCQSEHLNKLLGEVLDQGPYEVVHFNMGLHGWQKGRIKDGTFEPLTKAYVEVIRRKLPKARIIWASSTPVTVKGKPTELDPEINPIIVEHNRMAAKVMAELGVPVNDFYSLLVTNLSLARGDQFHWNAPAYQVLAQAAAESVRRALGSAPAAIAPAAEPTNAQEAAARKSQQERAVEEKYQAWLAARPPEHQAWEQVLQENLGSFYLPLHKLDKVRGTSNAWDYVRDDPTLPRVLLIGDSISRGYTLAVRQALTGKANVHRAPENCGPTANALKKLDAWLGTGRWDVIHFNFGIHDRATPPGDYARRLKELAARMRARSGRLIWASTTPLPAQSRYGDPEVIVRLNEAAAQVMREEGVAVNDLYARILPDQAALQSSNDCHFGSAGYDRLGGYVAEAIAAELK